MSIDAEIFDRAEFQRVALEQRLQVSSDELICTLLLTIAKNLGVEIPEVFNKLVTNYAIFLNPDISGSLNIEKHSIQFYCGEMGLDILTLNCILSNLIARKMGIAGVGSMLSGDLLPNLQPPKDGW